MTRLKPVFAAIESRVLASRPLTGQEAAKRGLRSLGPHKRWIVDQEGRLFIATAIR